MRFLYLFLLGSLLAGCAGDFPVDISVQGLPLRPMQAAITSSALDKGQFVLKLENQDSEVRVVPWPHSRLPRTDIDSLRSFTRVSPSGPSYVVELLADGEVVIIVGIDTNGSLPILPEWRGVIGKPIGPSSNKERLWVELLLQGEGVEKTALPGKPVSVDSRGQEWTFLVFGASIPNPASEDTTVIREENRLSIDWLLYRAVQ
jgi:hypothetical protein